MNPAVLTTVVFAILVALWQLFARVWTRPSGLRTAATRLSLSLGTLLICLVAAEVYCYNFVIVSDGFGFTLASHRWMQKHWWPVNSLGYRDLEPDSAAIAGRRLLVVVGDSFVAGDGTADYRDRFANVLGAHLGDGWRVNVVAKRGWNTPQEIAGLRRFPLAPDVVVLSYYVNDIEVAAAKAGRPRPGLVVPPPRLLRPFVDNLYSLNYAYWRLYRFREGGSMGAIYRRYLIEVARDDQIWLLQLRELRSLVQLAERRAKRVVAVVFPTLVDTEASRPLTTKVVQLLRRRRVEVLDLAPRLAGRDTASLIVNRMNVHPSVALHHEVADLLYEMLRAAPETVTP